MRRVILLLISLLAITAFFSSCSDDKIIKYENPTVTVTGKVYGWSCGTGDCRSISGSEYRYSVCTGLPATVKFIKQEDCCTNTCQTDDSSNYIAKPEVGDYFIVVETRHGCPDTVFSVTLKSDTIIDFKIDLEYKTHDTVFVDYFYPDPIDSMGYQSEWLYIRSLDDRTGNMLALDGTNRVIYESVFSDWIVVCYHIPTKPEYAPWQVYINALPYLAISSMPPEFCFYLDYWLCLW